MGGAYYYAKVWRLCALTLKVLPGRYFRPMEETSGSTDLLLFIFFFAINCSIRMRIIVDT